MGVPADRIHVVPNGIDVVGFRVGRGSADPGRRRLLYVGRLTPGKGIEVLARAFGELAARRRDVDLTVVGNVRGNDVPNGYEAALRAQFAKFGGRVEFVGHQGDICPILASADLLVVPLRCGEAFGRVVLEGMAAGLPVVASRDGGIPEILDEAFPGHLVPAGDSRALAGCLGEFIDWRATMPSLGGAMRRHVEKRFAQHTMISRVERVFEQVFEQVA
jgi:glycosyltransferase involved in cell wall biosynthesis